MAQEKTQKKEIKLEISASEEIANGTYSNFVIVNQSETEFTMDYIFVQPQTPKAKIRSRIIMNPIHAKRLAILLNKQIETYEKRFGEIPANRNKTANSNPSGSGNMIN